MARTSRDRPALWPWTILLLVSLGVSGGIAWDVWPRLPELPGVRPRPAGPESPPRPATGERWRVRLFFPDESRAVLREQERDLSRRGSLTEDVRAVLRELATSAEPGARAPLPPGAEVRQVFLDAFGILYLDFTQGFQRIVSQTWPPPDLALAAVVTTLTMSFSEVERVQFLAEGKELAVLLGEFDLRRPITPRFPSDEASPVGFRPADGTP